MMNSTLYIPQGQQSFHISKHHQGYQVIITDPTAFTENHLHPTFEDLYQAFAEDFTKEEIQKTCADTSAN